jgi:hypothetical protein
MDGGYEEFLTVASQIRGWRLREHDLLGARQLQTKEGIRWVNWTEKPPSSPGPPAA